MSSLNRESFTQSLQPVIVSRVYDRCLAQSTNQLGNTTATECGTTASDTTGCTVDSSSDASDGEAFAAAGGGVYVAEFASDGIRIWFFSVCTATDLTDISGIGANDTAQQRPIGSD
jgi:hypothetical protein